MNASTRARAGRSGCAGSVGAQGDLVIKVANEIKSAAASWRTWTVKNPLDSLLGTVICGLILTAVLYVVANAIMPHVAAGGS
jgi:hypothetical protein